MAPRPAALGLVDQTAQEALADPSERFERIERFELLERFEPLVLLFRPLPLFLSRIRRAARLSLLDHDRLDHAGHPPFPHGVPAPLQGPFALARNFRFGTKIVGHPLVMNARRRHRFFHRHLKIDQV